MSLSSIVSSTALRSASALGSRTVAVMVAAPRRLSQAERSAVNEARIGHFSKLQQDRLRIEKKRHEEEAKTYRAKLKAKEQADRAKDQLEQEKKEMREKVAAAKAAKVKRAGSALTFYVKQNAAVVREKEPGLMPTEVLAKLARDFKTLSVSEKAPFVKLAEEDKLRAQKERAEKKAKRNEGKTLSPYMKFMVENRADVAAQNPGLAPTDIVARIGLMWRELAEDVKVSKYGMTLKPKKAVPAPEPEAPAAPVQAAPVKAAKKK